MINLDKKQRGSCLDNFWLEVVSQGLFSFARSWLGSYWLEVVSQSLLNNACFFQLFLPGSGKSVPDIRQVHIRQCHDHDNPWPK